MNHNNVYHVTKDEAKNKRLKRPKLLKMVHLEHTNTRKPIGEKCSKKIPSETKWRHWKSFHLAKRQKHQFDNTLTPIINITHTTHSFPSFFSLSTVFLFSVCRVWDPIQTHQWFYSTLLMRNKFFVALQFFSSIFSANFSSIFIKERKLLIDNFSVSLSLFVPLVDIIFVLFQFLFQI